MNRIKEYHALSAAQQRTLRRYLPVPRDRDRQKAPATVATTTALQRRDLIRLVRVDDRREVWLLTEHGRCLVDARFYILNLAWHVERPGIDWASVFDGNDRGVAIKLAEEGLLQKRRGGIGEPLEIRHTTEGLDAYRRMAGETADRPDVARLLEQAS